MLKKNQNSARPEPARTSQNQPEPDQKQTTAKNTNPHCGHLTPGQATVATNYKQNLTVMELSANIKRIIID